MAFVEVVSSELAPDVSPVRIHYREAGGGPPLVILHGGWGYEIYPFDRQIAALDKSGFGETLAKGRYKWRMACRRGRVQEPDHRHARLLRSRGERYRDYQARTSAFFPLPPQNGVVT